jgi:hypothetical protein
MRGQTAYAWRGDSHEGPYEWIDEPVVAANNKSYAYYARTNGDDFVVLNGIRQRLFRSLTAPRCLTLSQDGRHAAYHARVGDAHYVVLDGDPVDHQDTRGRAVRIRLSPDGRRLAYGIWNQTSNHLWWVVDSLPHEEFDFHVTALHFVFSPDSRHWAYTAFVKGLGWRVIIDGKPSEWMDWIDNASLVFSPDSRKLAYGARKGRELWWKVVDVK